MAYMGPCNTDAPGHGYGWLNSFMHAVNSTFPHPDHILINNGVPASDFRNFAHGTCLENLIPKQPDLVILEHLPYLEGNNPDACLLALEQLVNRLQYNFNLSSFPAMIFLNMHLITDTNYTNSRGTISRDKAAKCLGNSGLCRSLCPDQFVGLPAIDSNSTAAELVTNLAAKHYGAASLSYTNLLSALMESSARGNRTECEVFAAVYDDPIHPNHGGQVLLADLLVNYLDGALEHFHSNGQQQAATGAGQSIISRHGRETPAEHGGIAPIAPLIVPMNNNSVKVPLMQCYGQMIAVVAPLNEEDVGSHGLRPSSKIDVVKAEGWAYVEVEANKTKPGWISTTPGSILWMPIDTNFSNLVDPHYRYITLVLLSSYQHMGQAEVTCASGCQCEKSRIDCHITDQKHSIPKLHSFLLTSQHGRHFAHHPGSKKIHARSGTAASIVSKTMVELAAPPAILLQTTPLFALFSWRCRRRADPARLEQDQLRCCNWPSRH